jgi:hypothetical protein
MNQDDFSSLSNFLLGIPLTKYGITALDPALAQSYFDLLRTNGVDLSALLAAWHPIAGLPPSEQPVRFASAIQDVLSLWTQAQMLVMLWYTGVWDQSSTISALNSRSAALYGRTLVWVLTQAQHVAGVQKSFGYWQYDPSEHQS